MKKLYTMLLMILPFGMFAQTEHQHHDKCLTDHYYREYIKNNPEYLKQEQQLEIETHKFVNQYIASKQGNANKSAGVVKVIPVVFHVIHEGGAENISRAQCLNQLETLNQDFRRLNADTTNTPAAFQSLGGDCEVEFRIATLDPQGNCTDGVVRVFSTLTNNARDNVKALSYWPRDQYLNIWVVKSIENTSGGAGIVVGFAQFPGIGPAATDGIVLKNDFTGSIGTAASSGNFGRTATHEIGHWLNLRHIWGDAVCGSDFVLDTPTQQAANQSNCPAFPHITCGNGPNGDMYTNYMDYTNGNCQNIFSIGQCARMNATLNSSTSGRNNLWTSANLIATGTTGTPGAVCVPVADFTNNINIVCEGTTINFTDGSWNSDPTSWQWDFPGGTPSSSPLQNPAVQYNTAGVYDVTLTVTNSAGTDSKTLTGNVTVVPALGANAVPYAEGFESITFPGTEWPITNGGGNTWTQTTLASHTGSNSVYINNYTGNTTNTSDIFLTPTYNLSNVTQANLTFWLAFAARSTASTDQLKVYASTSCGQLWAIRYNKSGTTLSTAGVLASNFTPNATQWRQETVNIASSSYNNKPNVRFKFEYLQNTGNNIFIDDINLDGTVGINEVLEEALNFSVYPNPSMSVATLDFTLTSRQTVRIDVLDVMGRIVNEIAETTLEAGEYQFELPAGLAAGLYSVRLNADGYITSRKIMINK